MRLILVRKKVHHRVGRPLVHLICFFIYSLIGGNIFLQKEYVSFFYWALLGCGMCLGYVYYFNWRVLGIALLGLGLAGAILGSCKLSQETRLFKVDQVYELEGIVDTVQETEYGQCLTLKSVNLLKEDRYKLKNKVQIWLDDKEKVTRYDAIGIQAKDLEIQPQMNPSDFNKSLYLKGQNTVAILKGMKVLWLKQHTPLVEKLQCKCCQVLEQYISPQYVGIMEAVLVGDESKMPERTKVLYKEAGISHLLCISGFHVGVVAGLFFTIMSLVVMPYTLKQLLVLAGIIEYMILTGSSPSTVRASLMVSTTLIGKCLWQEDDRLTNLALAAGSILMMSPYQLYMPGFQLSFMAVLGVILCLEEIEKQERLGDWKYSKWQQALLIWGSVQLMTWPILAYHFCEVAFGLSLINLFIIPIFSWVIIGGWLIIGFGMMRLPVSLWIARSIETVLFGIEKIVEHISQWPLAHLCTGRPSWIQYSLYILLVLGIGAVIWQYCSKRHFCYEVMVIAGLVIIGNLVQPERLKVNGVYVGQGDSSVIEIPGYGVLVIDGGNYGKGKIVENYVKYLGYDRISGIMVSHSDADHMGGIVDLIQDKIPVERVFLPEIRDLETFKPLEEVCRQEHIPIEYLKAHEYFQCGRAKVTCMSPIANETYESGNDTSIVCKLEYGEFSALFTGDKSITSDEKLYETLGPITLLKVSHHGSRTGTSKEMLLNLRPRYAMISCGRKNRYGHPHQEVVELLKASHIDVGRTDRDGLISYETDGHYLIETKYRKDA